jgi:V/A-type H+-transporting ATPase subunit A
MLRLLHESEQEPESLLDWSAVPSGTLGLLREADELKQIAAIIGPAALSDRQQWTFFAAGLIREGFLQQNALDAIDTYCTPEKQMLLAVILLGLHERGVQLIEQGVTCRQLSSLPSLAKLKRARLEIPNERLDLLEQLRDQLSEELARVSAAESTAPADEA